MKFTWYTYAAAFARAQADFLRVTRDRYTIEEVKDPTSPVNKTFVMVTGILKRQGREQPHMPPRAVREVADWFYARRYGLKR